MKTNLLLLALLLTLPAIAADPPAKKGAKKGGKNTTTPTSYDAVRIWDKDTNRQIEGEEAVPLRAAVAEATAGVIKALDTDNDGKLSDAELAALNASLKAPSAPAASADKPAKPKGKKKKAAEAN